MHNNYNQPRPFYRSALFDSHQETLASSLDLAMLKIVSHLLVLLFAVTSSIADAATEKFSEVDSLAHWITFYYVNPEPLLVGEAIHAASAKGFMKSGKRAPPFIGFISGVVNKNPEIATSLAEKLLSLPEIDQPVLVLGIWYSGHPETSSLLQTLAIDMPAHKEMIEHLLRSSPPGLLEVPLEQGPWVLDALWGYFMATGDDAPVSRIITALPWVNVQGNVSLLTVGGAARWSLISNAIQHKRIMQVCRKAMSVQSGEVKTVLGEVIASAEKDMQAGKTE